MAARVRGRRRRCMCSPAWRCWALLGSVESGWGVVGEATRVGLAGGVAVLASPCPCPRSHQPPPALAAPPLLAVNVQGSSNIRFTNCAFGVNQADNLGGAGGWNRQDDRQQGPGGGGGGTGRGWAAARWFLGPRVHSMAACVSKTVCGWGSRGLSLPLLGPDQRFACLSPAVPLPCLLPPCSEAGGSQRDLLRLHLLPEQGGWARHRRCPFCAFKARGAASGGRNRLEPRQRAQRCQQRHRLASRPVGRLAVAAMAAVDGCLPARVLALLRRQPRVAPLAWAPPPTSSCSPPTSGVWGGGGGAFRGCGWGKDGGASCTQRAPLFVESERPSARHTRRHAAPPQPSRPCSAAPQRQSCQQDDHGGPMGRRHLHCRPR
jgi:hypothetical protein